MLVRAIRTGFYNGDLKYPGKVFDMVAKAMKKDKKDQPVLPSWVEPANKPVAVPKEEQDSDAVTDKGQNVI